MKIKLTNFFRIQRLHLFSDGIDTFVAYDQADAIEAWKEHTCEQERDKFSDEFEQVPDRRTFTIRCERVDLDAEKRIRPPFSKVWDNGEMVFPMISAPAWAWALQNGRGFLSSTEW